MSAPKPKSERNKPLQLDDAAASALTALLAARDGLATEAQIDKALAEKRKRAGGEQPPPRLAQVLVEQGVIDADAAKKLERKLDPEVIPGYRILAEVGRGGMGTVFKARQLSMDRVVALKVLAKRLSSDERYVEKFLKEARAAGKLNHENVVSAIDCGEASGLHYFVMEFIDGQTVAELLAKDGPLPWEKAFEYAESVARALDHAHAHGLVHRDVKPENVMVSQTPAGTRVKLCDLGLAKELVPAGTGEKSKMTEGTPSYCSPEQALGRTDIDGRSDVYSLGATLFHALSGELPFDGENARAILYKQVHKPFPDLGEKLPSVPPALRELLARMVEKDREKRLPSMRAFLDELAQARTKIANGTETDVPSVSGRASGAKLAAAAAAFLVLAVVVGVVVGRGSNGPSAPPIAQNPPPAPPNTTNNPDPEPPPPPGGNRPKVVVIDPTPPPPPPPSVADPETPKPAPDPGPRDTGASEVAKAAQLLLDRATQFRDTAPEDTSGYSARLKQVVEKYPGTPAAVFAEKELAVLGSQGLAALEQDLDRVRIEAAKQAAAGKWKEALGALDGLSEKWDARVLAPHKPAIEKARTKILDLARAQLGKLAKDVDAKVAKGESVDDALLALDAFAKDAPAPVDKEAHARAEDVRAKLALAAADRALAEATKNRDDAFGKGALDEGATVIAEVAKDPKVQPRKAALDALVAETESVKSSWHRFDDEVKALEQQPKHVYKRRGAAALEGQLKDYDPVAWTAKVKPFGLKELTKLDLRDLPADDLVELAIASKDPKEYRAAALFFLARREADVAAAALDKMVAAGGADDPLLRSRVARQRAEDNEARARALVDKALAPGAVNESPEDVIALVKAIVERYADTAAYGEKLDDLKKVYVASRVARLTGPDCAGVFSATRVTRTRDTFKLEYDFAKDQVANPDWVPDLAVSKDSATKLLKNRLVIKGKVRNLVTWEAGALSFDARLLTTSQARPNVNLIISEKGGWTGLLVGYGFIYGGMNRIRVWPGAPKKPGWREPVPANVCYDLDGREPQADGKCLVAEQDPSCPVNRAIHYVVKRDQKGYLQGKLGSQTPITVANSPHADEAGSVAIAGFETELAVEHVELVGRVEPTWLADRARQIADGEAAQFPKKKPLAPPPAATPPSGN